MRAYQWLLASLSVELSLCATTFHYFGDPQIGFGLEGWKEDVARFQFAAAAASSSAHVVIAGDLVNQWNNTTQLGGFKAVWPAKFPVPVDVVPGNHDVGGKNVVEQLKHFRSTFGADYHATSLENVLILNIDSETLINNITGETERQWSWIEDSLKQKTANEHAFLVMHHPPFLHTETENVTYWSWPLEPRARLLKLVRSYGVGHILAGHTHTTTEVTSSDGAFTIFTVGGTARVFDKNGFGYREVTVDGSTVSQVYVKLPGHLQSRIPCQSVERGTMSPHSYECLLDTTPVL